SGTDRMSTEQLVDFLVAIEGRPWAEYNSGKPITKTWLSRRLARFDVSSRTITLSDGSSLKGYYRSLFDDAFARYLAAESGKTSDHQKLRASGERANVDSKGGRTFCAMPDRLNTRETDVLTDSQLDDAPDVGSMVSTP